MKKQLCKVCIAFDDHADYCRLGRQVEYNYKYFEDNGRELKYKEFSPVSKCVRPKNKKEFFDMFREVGLLNEKKSV